MNILDRLQQFFQALVDLAFSSDYAIPFWAAVIWFLLLLNRRASIRMLWRKFNIVDETFEKELFSLIDLPLQVLLMTLAIMPFMRILPAHWGPMAEKAGGLVAASFAVYIIVQACDALIFKWYFLSKRETHVPTVFRFVVLASIYALFGMLILDWAFGVHVIPLIATSTVLTAVLGLSLQDTLKNLFAGLTMSLEKRFHEGDWIMSKVDPVNPTVGEVVEIGWRTTKIKTPDNNYAIIPNSQFTANQLINFSSPTTTHAISIDFPIALTADLQVVQKVLEDAARKTQGVLKEPPPAALAVAVKPDHLLFRLRFWINEHKIGELAASAILQKAYKSLRDAQATPGNAAAGQVSKVENKQDLEPELMPDQGQLQNPEHEGELTVEDEQAHKLSLERKQVPERKKEKR